MITEKFYTYLGVNGTITSPVFLENIYSIKKYRLTAESGKILVCGSKKEKMVLIPTDELELWHEEDIGLDDLGYNL